MNRPSPKPPAQCWPEEVLSYTFSLRQENKRWRERVQILEARQVYAEADVARLEAEVAQLRALVIKLGGNPSDAATAPRRPVLASRGVQA